MPIRNPSPHLAAAGWGGRAWWPRRSGAGRTDRFAHKHRITGRSRQRPPAPRGIMGL